MSDKKVLNGIKKSKISSGICPICMSIYPELCDCKYAVCPICGALQNGCDVNGISTGFYCGHKVK